MKEILKHVDHTLLLQGATWEEIKQICDDAMKYQTVLRAYRSECEDESSGRNFFY